MKPQREAYDDILALLRPNPIPVLFAVAISTGAISTVLSYAHYKILGFDLIWSMSPGPIIAWISRIVKFGFFSLAAYAFLYTRDRRNAHLFSDEISSLSSIERNLSEENEEASKKQVLKERIKRLIRSKRKTDGRRIDLGAVQDPMKAFSESMRQIFPAAFGVTIVWFLLFTALRLMPIGNDKYCGDSVAPVESSWEKIIIQIPHFFIPQCKTILIDLAAQGESNRSPKPKLGVYQVGRFADSLFFIEVKSGASLTIPAERIVASSTGSLLLRDLSINVSQSIQEIDAKLGVLLEGDTALLEKFIRLEADTVGRPMSEIKGIISEMSSVFGIRPEVLQCAESNEPIAKITFAEGDFSVDAKQEQEQLESILEQLSTPQLERRSILVVGFASPTGSPLRNFQLSQGRAETVAKYLRDRLSGDDNVGEDSSRVIAIGRGERWRYRNADYASNESQQVAEVYVCAAE